MSPSSRDVLGKDDKEGAEKLGGLDDQHDGPQDSVQAGDVVLPEGEVGHGIHGGNCQHQDAEHGGQLLVEVIL